MYQNNNTLIRKVDVVTKMSAGLDKPSPHSGDEMINSKKTARQEIAWPRVTQIRRNETFGLDSRSPPEQRSVGGGSGALATLI
jgi:hypothetical protein